MMSTLEKTIGILRDLSENEIETVYYFVQFLNTNGNHRIGKRKDTIDDILNDIVGALPDSGKTLEEYREERINERYGPFN